MKVLLLGGNGYIGSKFYEQYNKKYDITSVDLCLFNTDLGYSLKINYIDYLKYNLDKFDIIICLAGHSSVGMAEHNPQNSWYNNVEYFRYLSKNLSKTQKLIYASSASVYGNTKSGISKETSDINFNILNHYDLQKIIIDLIANKFIGEGKNIVGFRFGTVNGASPNTRSDLMINSMVKSALETKKINIKNPQIRRAILGINDLVKALDLGINNKITPGQYNLASFNSTVEKMAKAVADKTHAELVYHDNDALAYDFELSTDKFYNETNFKFSDSLNNLIDELINSYTNINLDNRNNDREFKL